jgi:hypothetical protein
LRVEEGVTDESFEGRRWETELQTMTAVRAGAQDQKEEQGWTQKPPQALSAGDLRHRFRSQRTHRTQGTLQLDAHEDLRAPQVAAEVHRFSVPAKRAADSKEVLKKKEIESVTGRWGRLRAPEKATPKIGCKNVIASPPKNTIVRDARSAE